MEQTFQQQGPVSNCPMPQEAAFPPTSKMTKRSPSAEDATSSSCEGDGHTITSTSSQSGTTSTNIGGTTNDPTTSAEEVDASSVGNLTPPPPAGSAYAPTYEYQGETTPSSPPEMYAAPSSYQNYPYGEQQQQQSSYYPQDQEADYCYYDYQQQQQQQQFIPPPPAPLCYGCGTKSTVFGSEFCSRRCAWLCNNQCPHCGKHKMGGDSGNPSLFIYCSRYCTNQSAQANWCTFCGVCQNSISGACSNMQCRGSSSQQQQQQQPIHSSSSPANPAGGTVIPQLALGGKVGGKHYSKMECRLLNSSDISRSGLPTVFGTLFSTGLGSRIVTAVKLTAWAPQRKRYLAYRSIVENQMSAMGAYKYGHGGEGNEQRRYFGLPVRCSLGAAAPVAPSAVGGGGFDQQPSMTPLRTCHDPQCLVCQVLSKGFDMSHFGTASHYCNTTLNAAAQYLEPSPKTNLKAIVVARVVVGNPEVHVVDGSSPTPPVVQPPQDSLTNHSLIFTTSANYNDTTQDGTYVFSDEAVDPQYLVLFQ